ncbi:hypothetical protein SAMN05421721_102109 [Ectothiorhodospira mobilis]|uniref:Uncharacterized protein n=1 Tax=Ectothiorhodospira mobilis TaxID=195064 RepID=A0A1I4PPV3_ECTMO|nr:hypothetical protein SAMN05421721_102109 [Ectothiorhodospira mobilis]
MEHTAPVPLRARAGRFVESRRVQRLIIALILVNAVLLGLEAMRREMASRDGDNPRTPGDGA